ncbi:DUF6161 domain-containing protein [Microbulbifer sp. CNSA002]|uniref:DUF6161 domain-containing protein n=1 Tax=unclassified Microbulbifer TaxID=2619833 RepID=UPI0039B60590
MNDEASEIEADNTLSSVKKIKLPLRDGNEPYTFNSVEQLEVFISEEKNCWEWLNGVPAQWSIFSKHLKTHILDVVLSMLSSVASHWKNKDMAAVHQSTARIEDLLNVIDFPFSCRKKGRAILHERKYSNIVSINMLYLSCVPSDGFQGQEIKKVVDQYLSIASLNRNSHFSKLYKAFVDSEPFRLKANRILNRIELFGIDSEIEKVSEELTKVCNEVSSIKELCEESSSEFESWKSDEKKEYIKWVGETKRDLNVLARKVLRKFVTLKTTYIRRSSKVLSIAEKEVSSAKDVYLSQVELNAAVTYWETKKSTHNNSRKIWLGFLITLLVITSISPFLIMKYLPVKELADDKLLLNVLNPATLITTVLVISILSFSIRLCSKQFSTQQHLYLEAEERKTMLKTYLALMNEGKLVEQEDRKLALDALFRPAQTGMVTESGNIVPSDSVVKIIERQSGKT